MQGYQTESTDVKLMCISNAIVRFGRQIWFIWYKWYQTPPIALAQMRYSFG